MKEKQLPKIDFCSGLCCKLLRTYLMVFLLIASSLNLMATGSRAGINNRMSVKSLNKASITVNGTITDDQGAPLPGATIVEKGTNNSAMSDMNGNYSIKVESEESVLIVSFFGFETQEVLVGSQTTIDISMVATLENIDEVVVVGYGTTKKSDVTGSLIRVSAEELTSMPVRNTIQAMQGKVAGVDITSNERPGEVGRILIRGVRSINATNDPLYVVDGIPLAAGGIDAINPADIEAIDILKDASATAIYGSRGANGVIIVSTKKGKSGALSLNLNSTVSIENMYDRTEMMGSAQYIDFRRDSYRRIKYLNPAAAANTTYPDDPTIVDDQRIFGTQAEAWANINKGWETGSWDGSAVPTTDWTGMVLKTGITQEHNLNVSGGNDKINAYASFGYLDQDGTQLGQDYKRYTGTVKVEVTPMDWFKMGSNISGTFGNQNYGFNSTSPSGARTLYFAAQGMLPYAVPYTEDGTRINLPGGDVNIRNPIGEDIYNINQRLTNRLITSSFAEIQFMKGLKYRFNFGYDIYSRQNGIFRDNMAMDQGGGEPGSINFAQYDTQTKKAWTLDNLIYYDKKIEKHSFGLTLLQTASAFHDESSSISAENLPWDAQKWYQMQSVALPKNFGTGLTETALTSYMGRVNYNYDDKYLFTASARWDGATQLSEGHKWDFFPSAAIAWRIDQEEFMKNLSFIDQLKLRVGFGATGNSAVAAYATTGAITQLYYTWGAVVDGGYVSSDPSLAASDQKPMANTELGWEHTTQYNVGLDFGFLGNRLSGSVDVYMSTTNDLLMIRPIPTLTGYNKIWQNIGVTENKGIDLSINSINLKTQDFNWTTNLTFSASRDEIIELTNGKQDLVASNLFIGQRVSVYYDYQKDGIWQDTPEDQAEMALFNANGHAFRPGSIKVKDQDGDYKIDANNDRVIRGHRNPDWTGGLNNTLTYKGIDFSFFIFARWKFSLETGAESLQGRFGQRVVDYWTPNNPTNDYPAPNYNSAAGDTYKSSMNYQDGSFIKLRNVSLGYTLPKMLVKKAHLSNVRFYAQVMNPVLIYSAIDWIDPDLGGSTFNRSWIFGLNIGF